MKPLSLVLVLALVTLAHASSVNFSNLDGTLTGSNNGLSLTGSILTSVSGFDGVPLVIGNLGTLQLATGALTSGSLAMGGTFAAGGTFSIVSNGSDGLPKGTLFTGTFNDPVKWTLVTLADGTHDYTLTGVITGLLGGVRADGITLQLTMNTGTNFFNGSTRLASGDTNTTISAVPELGTFTLLGTGLGATLLLKRKISFV